MTAPSEKRDLLKSYRKDELVELLIHENPEIVERGRLERARIRAAASRFDSKVAGALREAVKEATGGDGNADIDKSIQRVADAYDQLVDQYSDQLDLFAGNVQAIEPKRREKADAEADADSSDDSDDDETTVVVAQ